jgi:outer membrane protein OmpA-like peptidoglycan-associated protein
MDKIIFSTLLLISTLTGCTKAYTNQQLISIFNDRGLETEDSELGVVVFIPGIYFKFNKADLTQPARLKVKEIAAVVNDPRVIERKLLLEGHTDSSGSYYYNLNLSNLRAEAVKEGLISEKVSADRMTVRGYGEKYPVAENRKPDGSWNTEGQAKNRRVEIVVKNTELKQ